jgi:ABC-2 type transport system ATP-binding protein
MNSVILEARSLTKEYKQTLALDHINLQIKKSHCNSKALPHP